MWNLDLALEELSGRAHGQLVNDPHDARVVVGRDAFADGRLDILRGELGARVEHDGRRRSLRPWIDIRERVLSEA